MSQRRGAILEITGHSAAYATHAGAPATWATTIRQSILSIPRGSILSVDFDSFKADTGGTDVVVGDASAELLHRSTGATAILDGDHTAAVTTITVLNVPTAFPASGTLWIGQEAITYTGKTATTLTGCTRARLGTDAFAHKDTSVVYSYNPTLLGRKCVLKWYDLDDTATTTTRYTGYIDALDFNEGGYRLQIISAKKKFEDSKGLHLPQGKCRSLSAGLVLDAAKWLDVEFDDEGDNTGFITLPANSPNWPYFYLRVDDELLRYRASDITNPKYSTTVATIVSGYEITVSDATGFHPGRNIEFLSGGNVAARATILESTGTTVKHNANYSPSGGDVVRVPGVARIDNPQRGALFTRRSTHDSPIELHEYRVLEGNHVDITLWLVLSQTGDKSNSEYDILPEGWGAKIPSALVDIATFEKIVRPRATPRRYVLPDEIDLLEWLGRLATATNTRIYWGTDGLLTANEVHDIFPLDVASQTVTTSNLIQGQIPQLRLDMTQIRNVWEWPSDYDLDGDYRALMRVEIAESRRLYGDLPMPRMEDRGMRAAEHNAISYAISHSILSQRSAPVTILTVQVLFQEASPFAPGDLVLVTIGHLPNMAGGRGITGEIFEVLSYTPQEDEGTAELVLAQHQSPTGLGHVSPVCIVQSVSGNDVTVRPRSFSKYAPAAINYPPPGNGAESGLEDVHWFLANDAIRFVDVSTFGAAPPTSAATTISSINYGTRVVTVAAAPAWLAAGDLLRLDSWSTVILTSTVGFRQDIFIALADDTTEQLGGDAAYRWGI